jgi:hypothetical protein
MLCFLTMGCWPAILTVDGLVLVKGQESMLSAQLERQPVLGFRDGIENVWVRFFVGGCQVAEQLTADEGRAFTFRDLSPPTGSEFEASAVVDLTDPLLPQPKPSPKGGRKPINRRRVPEDILRILRTGARCKDPPAQHP